jgi:hypothetical protein
MVKPALFPGDFLFLKQGLINYFYSEILKSRILKYDFGQEN